MHVENEKHFSSWEFMSFSISRLLRFPGALWTLNVLQVYTWSQVVHKVYYRTKLFDIWDQPIHSTTFNTEWPKNHKIFLLESNCFIFEKNDLWFQTSFSYFFSYKAERPQSLKILTGTNLGSLNKCKMVGEAETTSWLSIRAQSTSFQLLNTASGSTDISLTNVRIRVHSFQVMNIET